MFLLLFHSAFCEIHNVSSSSFWTVWRQLFYKTSIQQIQQKHCENKRLNFLIADALCSILLLERVRIRHSISLTVTEIDYKSKECVSSKFHFSSAIIYYFLYTLSCINSKFSSELRLFDLLRIENVIPFMNVHLPKDSRHNTLHSLA